VTRDYVFDLDETGGAPLLNVFGGKITTFRKLAERGDPAPRGLLPEHGGDWTEKAPLPGGEIPNADYETFANSLRDAYPWMPRKLVHHYGRLYGARTKNVVADATGIEGLGRHFGGQLYEAEARYLVRQEWAADGRGYPLSPDQALLHLSEAERAAFGEWFASTRLTPQPEGGPMPLTLSLNTNPLVNRFADPDDLIETVARASLRDMQLTHEFINPSWQAPVIRRLTRADGQGAAAHRRSGNLRHDRPLRTPQPFRPPGCRCPALLHRLVQDLRGHHWRSRRHSVGTQFAIFTYKDFDDPGPTRGADQDRHRLLG
jgi:hypothetical protein